MCSNCSQKCESDKCRIAVTVEDNYVPCTFPGSYFGVEIRSLDGKTSVSGRVAGGGSAVFAVPCGGDYTVTVTGGEYSSPRAQTRRVCCCCGQTAGVTFIFMTYEPDCGPKFCPPPHPPCCCTPPCPPPKPPKPPKPCDPPKPPRPPKPPVQSVPAFPAICCDDDIGLEPHGN